MRFFFARILLIALSATVAGCAATESGQRFAGRSLWKKPAVSAKEKVEEDEESTASESVAQRSNPFRKTATVSAPDDSPKPSEKDKLAGKDDDIKPQTQTADKTSTEKPATGKGQKSPGEFTPETMKLIDAELADASAEERTFWYDQLKRVDPAVIPQILQARRLTADLVERRQQDPSWTESSVADHSASDREDRSIRQTTAKFPEHDAAKVRQAAGREVPFGKMNGNLTNRETEQVDERTASVPFSESQTEKPAYAAQRVTDAETLPPTSRLPNLSTPRNALNRFLPAARNGAVAESAANSPAAVSLLRPTELDPPGTWQQQLDPLISLLEAEVAQLKPGATEEAQAEYIERHVYLRMLHLMAQHPERALTAIPGIDSADQEFWQQLLWAMTNYFDVEHLPTAKDRAGQAVAQLATATQRLRERSELEIHNLAFCREIAHFGNFVRFPRDEFHPGDPALLYAEIENFKSELTVDGEYRTLIRSTMEILSPSGDVRWHKEFSAEEDLCANYRRDYFHNYEFTIPNSLPLGPHTLKLTVFDELSGKMVSQSVNFVVR